MNKETKIITVLSLLAFCSAGLADELLVPAEYPTIQTAIDAAIDGDVVIVAEGTYTGDGNRDIDFLGKAITVRSIDPNDPEVVAATIIDCYISGGGGYPPQMRRGFYFTNNEDVNSVVAGFTVIKAYDWDGSGIYCAGSSPTIANCAIVSNTALIYGGGILCIGGSPTITNCTFSGNSADYGGGIYCDYSSPTITNCRFNANSAEREGGGVFSWGDPTLTNCIFSGNSAGMGGGMYSNGSPTLTNCTFSGNSASCGGGMYNFDSSDATLTNCILWGNTAGTNGAEISLTDPISPSTLTISYSDVQGGLSAVYIDPNCSVTWSLGNIDADPCFIDAGYWDNNDTPGDPNDDIWVDGDYHLKSEIGRWEPNSETWVVDEVTSWCIDAGDPNSDWTAELWPHGKRINMGTYGGTPEASMSLSDVGNIANLDNDPADNVDSNDLDIFVSKWCEEEILIAEDLNRDGVLNFADYAIFADEWLW